MSFIYLILGFDKNHKEGRDIFKQVYVVDFYLPRYVKYFQYYC